MIIRNVCEMGIVGDIGSILTIVLTICIIIFIASVVVPWAVEHDGKPLFKRKSKR